MNAPIKAIVIHAARDLRIEEREAERAGPGQVEIALEAGGICGSDLHYFNHGGFGAVRLREPMILGHEASGIVIETGADVSSLKIGDRVCMEPGIPDPNSRASRMGMYNVDPAVPALQRLPLLSQGPAEPVPQHALLWLGHAISAYPGRLPPAVGGRGLAVPQGGRGHLHP